jgi:hypothetical protein
MTSSPRFETSSLRRVELGSLGLDAGAHLLVAHALAAGSGNGVLVSGHHPELPIHLRAWCRAEGHAFELVEGGAIVTPQRSLSIRRDGSVVTGGRNSVAAHAPAVWGLAARGAAVEQGTPAFSFPLAERDEIWTDEAGRLYAKAAAAQWDPATAIPWDAEFALPDEVEDAVVQIMTYLIENETAALIVPARFAAQIHPHFREVVQVLAIQAADEARHIEVFTRRAWLRRDRLGLSTAGGQASLKTLLDEADFALASFLLSVLGEGSFLTLLTFLHEHAPDPVTREVCRLAAQDEARHVAFGMAHLARHAERDATLRGRLALAVRRRHAALEHTSGLNAEVFDALVLLAAGAFEAGAIRRGHESVQRLKADMDEGRWRRLLKLGFGADEAAELSALHTRNFM